MPHAEFHIALAAECITPWAPGDEALAFVKSMGCTHIQLDFTQFPSGHDFTAAEAADLAEALDRFGLAGETLSCWPQGLTSARYADFLARVAEAAPILGLKVINSYIWPFAGASDDETLANYASALKRALDVARDNGAVITVEPEAHDLSRDVEGIRRILAAVDHPALKVNYDPCNFYHGGEEGFPYAYHQLRDEIAYVHLKNGSLFIDGVHPEDEKGPEFAPPKEKFGIRWGPIDEGAVNVSGLIRRLIADGYDGVVALEPHAGGAGKRKAFFAREVAYVRGEIERAAQERLEIDSHG